MTTKNDSQPIPAEPSGEPSAEGEAEEVVAQEGDSETLLELVLAEHEARAAAAVEPAPARIDGVLTGTLVGFSPEGAPLVDFRYSPSREGTPARAMAAIGPGEIGRAVALLFEGGDPDKPVVMGLMHSAASGAPRPEVEGDGERLVFSAEQEIVLRCGKASITLTRAGKILIRGAYLLARSSGVNRIQGGSVQIN